MRILHTGCSRELSLGHICAPPSPPLPATSNRGRSRLLQQSPRHVKTSSYIGPFNPPIPGLDPAVAADREGGEGRGMRGGGAPTNPL